MDGEGVRSESGANRTKVESVGAHNGLGYRLLYPLHGDYDATVVTGTGLECARFWGNLNYVARPNARHLGFLLWNWLGSLRKLEIRVTVEGITGSVVTGSGAGSSVSSLTASVAFA